jgi:hypothetical protein
MNNWCICWVFTHIFTGILICKGLTARRLYKSFGVKGLIKSTGSLTHFVCHLQYYKNARFNYQEKPSGFVKWGEFLDYMRTCKLLKYSAPFSSFGGLVVNMLAFGTQDRGFKPDRSRRIFFGRRKGNKAVCPVS